MAKKKRKPKKPFPRFYSRVQFWNRVNQLNRKHQNNVAYGLGLSLQDLEIRLLNTLEDLESSNPTLAK